MCHARLGHREAAHSPASPSADPLPRFILPPAVSPLVRVLSSCLQGPSSEALHLGHLVPFMFTKWLQVCGGEGCAHVCVCML
jgi:hypothetical protein